MAQKALSNAVFGCLALIGCGLALILLDTISPSFGSTSYNNPEERSYVLTTIGVLISLGGAIGCVLIYFSTQPDSSDAKKRFVQRIVRDAMGTEESASSPGAQPEGAGTNPWNDLSDDKRKAAARERMRHDIEFETVLRLAKDLHTLEAIQEWRKRERRKVLNDQTLSPDEQEERLEQIDSAAEREKKRIRNRVDV